MSRVWTWRHAVLESSLSSTTKHVLLVISVHMNDVGEGCYPSTKRIAALASLSERSVCTHIDTAESQGWLEVGRHGFDGTKWARHEYLPKWPPLVHDGWMDAIPATKPASYRQKERAHRHVSNGVASGSIVKQPCVACGTAAEAHHPDYDKPKDVIWLCRTHHKQFHDWEKRTERVTAHPANRAEPRTKRAERSGTNALKEVQSNTSLKISENLPGGKTPPAMEGGAFVPLGRDEACDLLGKLAKQLGGKA